MNIFPTRYSTLSAAALANYIQQQYGFSDTRCRYQLRGVSDTYQVQTKDNNYILKIFRTVHRSQEELLGEIELLEKLKANGIPVAVAIKDKTGNTLQHFQAAEGIRSGILYQFAAGRPVIEQKDEQIIQSANYLAEFHKQSEKIELGYNRKEYTIDTLLHKPMLAVRPAFEHFGLLQVYTELQDLGNKQETILHELHPENFSTGYCHYDFMPKNWHHDPIDQTITLFDFDFAGKGWLANDIASYAIYISLLTADVQDAQRRLELFIKEYTRLRPLHENELKALAPLGIFFVIFYLQYQWENFEDHTNVYFGPRFLRERFTLMDNYLKIVNGLY